MNLNNFIDFPLFADYDETWGEEGDFMICPKHPNHKYYVGSDIEGVDLRPGLKIMQNAKKSYRGSKSFIKLKDKFIKENVAENNVVDTSFYKSNDDLFYCFFIHLNYDGKIVYMTGLLDKENSTYVVVGAQNGFLFVKHHMFNYTDDDGLGCSHGMHDTLDGSETDSESTIDGSSTPLEIIDSMQNYYKVICQNKLHGAKYKLLGPQIFEQNSSKIIICDPTFKSDDTRTMQIGNRKNKTGKSNIQIKNIKKGIYKVWARHFNCMTEGIDILTMVDVETGTVDVLTKKSEPVNNIAELIALIALSDADLNDQIEWILAGRIASVSGMAGIFDLTHYEKISYDICQSVGTNHTLNYWGILPHGAVSGSPHENTCFDVYICKVDNDVVGFKIRFED